MNKRVFSCVIFILILMFTMIGNVFAVSVPTTAASIEGNKPANNVVDTAKNVWQTAAKVVQILAVAAVVFSGLRYMFSASDTKADIKQQTVILVLGATLVFAATTITMMIYNAATTVMS